MSWCRSSGCNNQPCSQSQKMSIGIVVDSFAKPRYGSKKEVDVSINGAEKEALNHNVQRRSTVQESSVRVTAGSVAANLNQVSRPAISNSHGKQSMHTFKSFAGDAVLEPGVGKKTEADGASGKENKKVFDKETFEQFPGEPKEKVSVQVKEVLREQTNEMENRSKEALRMKLRSILGTVHSENMFGNAETFEKTADETTREKPLKGDALFKPRQNSDTIETDSENADMTTKNPVTRSVARRRAPARMRPRNLKPKSLSSDKEEHRRSDVFSFGERCAPSPFSAVNRDRAKRSCRIKSGVMSYPVKNTRNIQLEELSLGGGARSPQRGCLDENLEPKPAMQDLSFNQSPVVRESSQRPNAETPAPQEKLEDHGPSPPRAVNRGRAKRNSGIKSGVMLDSVKNSRNIQPEELSFGGGATSPQHGCLDDNLEAEPAMENLNFNHSPVVSERSQQPNAQTPAPKETLEDSGRIGGQSPVHHVDDLNCQWFNVTKSVLSSPMDSCPLTNDKKQDFHESAQPDRGARFKAKSLSNCSTASEKDNSESSDDVDELKNTHATTSEPSTEDKYAANRLFNPVRRYCTDEASSAKKVYPEAEDVYTSPEISLVGKPMLFRSKRHCSHGVDLRDFSPPSHTARARGNADDVLTECLDESPEDGLPKVVSLLVSALKKVENKMTSVTNKRCSEILVSAAEEIQSHLQSVESQIQTELGKLTSLKTSKRKNLETKLQEQEENLKVVHEKFKKEIFQYIQDCKGAMEGLESQHIELQGAIERQKTLHRKLLSQTEAAMETHLTDAQRQIMSVRKLGKQKMQQLKFIIGECLKEGIPR